MSVCKEALLALICLAVLLQCSSLPANDISKEDLVEDENEIEEKKDAGIEDDKNSFDQLLKINEENDLTELYQGDIRQSPDDSDDAENQKRNTIMDKRRLWAGKTVPYVIDAALSGVEPLIELALANIANVSCLTFKKRTNEASYLNFFKDAGCWSYVGRQTTVVNKISIGRGCGQKGIIMHEVLHALGFWHEQARSDRSKYIEIFWENIRNGVEGNFVTNSRHELLSSYDYGSIMHYGEYAFSANGKKTIVAIQNPTATIGQRQHLSSNDISELNILYDCQSTSTDFYSTWGSWQPCDAYCMKKRQRFCSHTDFTKCPAVDSNGVQTESYACTQAECYPKINGHWGRWSSWATCSKSCDQGQVSRTRVCNDPEPRNGGDDCVGSKTNSAICKTKSCYLPPDDCEFETGWCSWTNEISADKLDWVRRSGATPTVGTGPNGDKTSGRGLYAYVEASGHNNLEQRAILNSKVMKRSSSGRKCLRFWYHMYGKYMGKLRVIFKDVSTGAEKMLVTISGNKGDKWRQEEVDIHALSDFQIKFEATIGRSYHSDIAIDDVFFSEKSCHPVSGPLGMEDRRIKNYQISSSSDWDVKHRSYYARLNQVGSSQWCASWQKHGRDQFIRVDFNKRKVISAVALQGQATFDNWVTSYKINYTEDGFVWKTYQENGIDRIFTGPTSRDTPVKQSLALPIHAFGIMVNPWSFYGNDICLRMEIYGYEDPSQPALPKGCKTPLAQVGIASGAIPDARMTATSIWDSNHQAYEARLNNYKVWCVNSNDQFQYLQIDLGKSMKIFGIATQGHPTWDNYVTSYEVTYGENGSLYYNVLGNLSTFTRRIFKGNRDRNSIVKHKFTPPIQARYVRIQPMSFIGNDICLRAELYGCEPV